MCLIPEQHGKMMQLKHAEDDIVAYKVVVSTGNKYTDKRKFLTGFVYKEITDTEINGKVPFSDPAVIPFPQEQSKIERGCIHSYKELKDALKYMREFRGTPDYYPAVFRVVIPKGTAYYEGVQAHVGVYSFASERLVFKEQLYCRIKDTDYEYSTYKVEEAELNRKKRLSHEKDPFE